ncbi:hypothetical protein CF326_g2215 [Tilletia indica]|nr:hypothetical protein CF326_g2215 [Tilletia indica]
MHPSAPASTPAGGGPAPSSSSSASVAAVPPPASAPFNPYELRFEDEHRPLPPSSRAQRAPLPPPFKLSSIPLEKRSELWNNPESADCIIIVPVPTREHEIPDVAFSPPTPAARETMKRKFEELRQAGAIPGLPSGPIPPPPGGSEPAGPAQIYQSVVGPQNAAAGPSSSSSGARNQEAPESLPALPRRDAQNFVSAPTPASSAAAVASASGPSSSEAPPQPIDPNRPVVYTEKMSAEEGRSFGLKLKAQLRLFELDKSSLPFLNFFSGLSSSESALPFLGAGCRPAAAAPPQRWWFKKLAVNCNAAPAPSSGGAAVAVNWATPAAALPV